MPVMRISPTRSNLFRLRGDLALAEEGHTLLEEKREILIMELLRYVHDWKRVREALEAELGRAFSGMAFAYLAMGEEEIERTAAAGGEEAEADVMLKSIMGVGIPSLQEGRAAYRNRPSLLGTAADYDRASQAMQKTLPLLYDYAHLHAALWRLATEIKKTQRRVRALETLFIPDYKDTVRKIEEILEENDREEFFRRKRLKGRSENDSEVRHA